MEVKKAVNEVDRWSSENKLQLNVQKCEVSIFASGSVDAKWQPEIYLRNQRMPLNSTPKFLGVRLDRTLSFQKHVEDIGKKTDHRCKLLRAVANKEWGW